MLVVKLVGVVAPATELRDVLLEGVLRVAAQVVLDYHIVRRRLCGTASVEGGVKRRSVGVGRLAELPPLVNVRRDEFQFQRLRDLAHASASWRWM